MIKDSGWFKTTKYYHYGDMVASNTAAQSLKTCNVCDLDHCTYMYMYLRTQSS